MVKHDRITITQTSGLIFQTYPKPSIKFLFDYSHCLHLLIYTFSRFLDFNLPLFFLFQDVILEVQGQAVSGYTQGDTVSWLNHCTRSKNPCVLRLVPQGRLLNICMNYWSCMSIRY